MSVGFLENLLSNGLARVRHIEETSIKDGKLIFDRAGYLVAAAWLTDEDKWRVKIIPQSNPELSPVNLFDSYEEAYDWALEKTA